MKYVTIIFPHIIFDLNQCVWPNIIKVICLSVDFYDLSHKINVCKFLFNIPLKNPLFSNVYKLYIKWWSDSPSRNTKLKLNDLYLIIATEKRRKKSISHALMDHFVFQVHIFIFISFGANEHFYTKKVFS